MKEYKFKVCLCDGHYCNGRISVTAENEDEAEEMALSHVLETLAEALPELGIDVSVCLDE